MTAIQNLQAKLIGAGVLVCAAFSPVAAQDKPAIVQPGAPGQPTRVLPATTRPKLPGVSKKDVEFMQGMIMHHEQAVEMVALMDSRTDNKELKLLGVRISHTQAEEIAFMRRWLAYRGEALTMQMAKPSGGGHAHHGAPAKPTEATHMMPGMLSPEQMRGLANAKGRGFDRLFLEGMIQHHAGALVMVKDLFDTPGAGQDSEVFNFATDVDSGQRAEIRVMEKMLGDLPKDR